MRTLRFALAGLAALVEATVAVALIFASNHETNPWLVATFAISAGLSFVAAGLVALWRRPENATGFWLAATGYLWFVAALGEANSQLIWTIGFVVGNLAFVSFATLILAYPGGTLTRHDRWLIAIGGVTAVGTNLIGALIVPETQSCDGCPESAVAVTNLPDAWDAVQAVGTVVIVGVLLAIVAILVRRWRRASHAQQRILRPVFLSCGIAISLLLCSVAADRVSSTTYSVFWLLFLASFAAVPLSFLWGVLRSRRARASAASLLLSLDAGAPLRDTLAQALHDPSLEVVYWLDDESRWIDADGNRVEAPLPSAERSVAMVDRDGARVAALVHDPALDDEPGLVESVAAAAALFLQNERLQAALRSQYLLLEAIANTAPSLLVNVGTDGRIHNQNAATLRASGLDDEEQIRGRFFWDVFIDPQERDEMRARFLAGAPKFPPGKYENTFTNARGRRLVIAWESAPVVDDEGTVVGIVAGGLDITDRKHHELELERSQAHLLATGERLRAVIQSSPAAIIEVDVEGVVKGWNHAAEQMFGYSAAEVMEKGVPDVPLVPEELLGELAMLFTRLNQGESFTGWESKRLRHDGTLFDVEIAAAPLRNPDGVITGHIALFSDITERKRHEEEIRDSRRRLVQAADEARRELERDLHDGAQQRLVALSLSLRLAESKLRTDTEAAAGILHGAREELAHALDELRELARGIHPAVLTERGLAAAVEVLVTRVPVPVRTQLPSGRLPAPIEAAAYFVIAEALTNVAKYASATSAEIRVLAGNRVVTVDVADDGKGGADPADGSGLRGLGDRVAALDGSLVVDSPPGAGTRIVAVLPVRATAHAL